MPAGITLPTVTPDDLLFGLALLAPVLVVVVTAVVVLLIDLIITDWLSRRPLMWISALGLLVALAACGLLWAGGYLGKSAFGGFLILDGFALFFEALFLVAANSFFLVLASPGRHPGHTCRERVLCARIYPGRPAAPRPAASWPTRPAWTWVVCPSTCRPRAVSI